MPGTTSPAKENSYKNFLYWGAVLLGVLLIPVAIWFGLDMVRSEVEMVSQKMEENIKQEIKIDMQETKREIIEEIKSNMYMALMASKDKQETKSEVPLIDKDLQSTWLNISLFDVQNATDWYNDLVHNSSKVEQVIPAVVAVHGGINDNFSNPFYIFDDGYLMRLRVYPNGHGKGEGTHVSVYLHLMKGPHDDELEQSGHWPLRGIFTIELLNQLNDSDHYSCRLTFGKDCDYITRAAEDNSTAEGWGISQFISHDSLLMNNNYTHYNNNSFYFRISYNQIAPVTIKLPGMTMKAGTVKQWISNPFFAFEGGYQMCLKIYIQNFTVAVLQLMKGPHDDELEQSGHWPLRGTFTIELLNQQSDHHSCMIQFDHGLPSNFTNRVLDGVESKFGTFCFIFHDTILHHNNSYHKSDSLIFGISYEDVEAPYQAVTPVTLKVARFSQWYQFYVSSFFAFEKGYQMCLIVDAITYGKGTHISVKLYLTKGPHDDELEQSGHWPLRGTFTIELLNPLNNSDHYSRMVQFHHLLYTNEVLKGIIATNGLGHLQFISHMHDTLFLYRYHKSDSLTFRISYEDVEEAPYQVAPVNFKMTKFSQWFKNNQGWSSIPFFAFEKGYQMYLHVYAAGYGEGEGTHVSVFLYLMKGSHDDKLEQSGHWPLRGTFTIELLNQLNDSDHYSRMVQFHHHQCSECTNRVLEGVMATKGRGIQRFISHETLCNHSNNSCDSLSFRISYKDVEEVPYQVAPVIFKITKFTQWLKSKSVWYSSPFFAFEEGYQMYLRVYAAGYGDSEGTHVSVFLYLMKGPHDDELEQSGHWPLRGTFTIELLNQLNDSDHYSRKVIYSTHTDGDNTNRVVKGSEASGGWGHHRFISHNILFNLSSSAYLKNDILNLRISYKQNERKSFMDMLLRLFSS